MGSFFLFIVSVLVGLVLKRVFDWLRTVKVVMLRTNDPQVEVLLERWGKKKGEHLYEITNVSMLAVAMCSISDASNPSSNSFTEFEFLEDTDETCTQT